MDTGTNEGNHVHVVDDDDSFRTGLTRVLNAAGLRAVGYRCAGEFLLSDAATRPGCIVLDICMPGPSGVELLDALATREISPPVIFVTGCSDISTSVHAMKSGAFGFLTKPVRTEALLESVRRALAIDSQRRRAKQEIRLMQQRYALLSERERAVFLGVVHGSLNKQLAVELNTCERTVKTHRARMLEKMQLNSLADLVRAARLLGIQDEPPENELPPVAAMLGAPQAAGLGAPC
ncbi:MAG TPA: response regulator [Povalibacter sp.]|uniref:response regulator transcription factor n=1 Tax=Povalibacter sp. TaxID=1962978 RepID=UPI002CF52A9B|nr:response regulator [Povalibacter sp.]HMN45615.1 response regulator [Povalibacter sp.]